MSIDNLKITVLRAAKPGDVVFFNVGQKPDQETRELVVALADYLLPTGIIPIMLPDNIRMVGSMFDNPLAFTEGERQSFLKAVEGALTGVPYCHLGSGDKSDLRDMYERMWPKAPPDIRMDALIKQIPIPSPRTADSPDPEKTQSTGVRDTDPSAG